MLDQEILEQSGLTEDDCRLIALAVVERRELTRERVVVNKKLSHISRSIFQLGTNSLSRKFKVEKRFIKMVERRAERIAVKS